MEHLRKIGKLQFGCQNRKINRTMPKLEKSPSRLNGPKYSQKKYLATQFKARRIEGPLTQTPRMNKQETKNRQILFWQMQDFQQPKDAPTSTWVNEYDSKTTKLSPNSNKTI